MDNQSAAGFMFMALCLHPKSRGRIDIVSSDPRHPPSINPDYLRHPYDMTCMRDAYKFAVRMVRTNAFQSLGASVHLPRFPECLVRTSQGGGVDDARALYQEYVSCIIRVAAISGHHPLGTARIGRRGDPLAVVDPQLKVIGTERVRVVDASVMPTQISGVPNSAITVIAEKASDLIKETWSDKSKLASEKICSTSADCEEKLLLLMTSSAISVSHISPLIIAVSALWATSVYPHTPPLSLPLVMFIHYPGVVPRP
ncbi:hypothetical protein OTU49_000176 [Cherax quadricarinatus]|uniref:Glucose-methanol-choline oxidoreductase C-terminal domain-containing protein n=4 Tax=Cherax quadricarinatus TaxID=27406 RepID=A0AAW0XLZ2_CHEQU